MTDYWLFREVLKIDNEREPQFATQSAHHWMEALRVELIGEHGSNAEQQFESFEAHFRRTKNPVTEPPQKAEVFEPLYHAVIHAASLSALAARMADVPSAQPTAVVTWYYALYFATRAMLAANGQVVEDTHAKVMQAYCGILVSVMPHPLNMLAIRGSGEKYNPKLPTVPSASSFDLQKSVDGDRSKAQGMLLQYLNGTTKYYADRTKRRVKRKNKLNDFYTKHARQLRDKALDDRIAFLHCAFRFRGKANYRDAIFLTYGSRIPPAIELYFSDLAAVANIYVLCAVAFVQRLLGRDVVRSFSEDLMANLRGLDPNDNEIYFWKGAF